MTTIKLKSGSGAPLASDLVAGEPALDLTNKRLYTENASGTVIEVGTNPTSLTTGTFTSTGIDDNATSTAITIDSSENVGIGTTSPSEKLHIRGGNGSGTVDVDVLVQDLSTSAAVTDAGIAFTGTQSGGAPRVDMVWRFGTRGTNATIEYNSNQYMSIDASGNVGIGTTSPSYPLQVEMPSNGSVGASFRYTNGTNNPGLFFSTNESTKVSTIDASGSVGGILAFASTGTERMRIDGSGNVGIGTSSPSTPLHVEKNTGTGGYAAGLIRNTSTTGQGNGLVVDVTNTPHTYIADFRIGNTSKMRIDSSGNVGIGTTSPGALLDISSASNTILRLNNTGTNSWDIENDSNLKFSRGGTERMRIDSSGNVGIGTSSPDAKLDVKASTATVEVAARFRKGSTADTGGHTTLIGLGTEDAAWSKSAIGHQRNDSYDVGDLIFCVNANATSGSDVSTSDERMRITSSGNVGIGTATINTFYDTAVNVYGSSHSVIQFQSSNTGTASSDGFHVGVLNGAATDAYIWNRESSNLLFGTAATERMRIDSSGNLLVGTTSPVTGQGNIVSQGVQGVKYSLLCQVASTSSHTHILFHNGASVGSISTSGSSTTYNTSSDERLKENIVDAPAGNIDAIRVRSFDWKADGSHQTYGMVAQELVDVAPEAVTQGQTEDDMWAVDYSKLVPMMIKEIQDLRARVAQLEGA